MNEIVVLYHEEDEREAVYLNGRLVAVGEPVDPKLVIELLGFSIAYRVVPRHLDFLPRIGPVDYGYHDLRSTEDELRDRDHDRELA